MTVPHIRFSRVLANRAGEATNNILFYRWLNIFYCSKIFIASGDGKMNMACVVQHIIITWLISNSHTREAWNLWSFLGSNLHDILISYSVLQLVDYCTPSFLLLVERN